MHYIAVAVCLDVLGMLNIRGVGGRFILGGGDQNNGRECRIRWA